MPKIAKAEIDATIDAVRNMVDCKTNAKDKRELIAELDRVIHPVAMQIRSNGQVDNPVAWKYGLPYPREFYCRYCRRYCYISARDLSDQRSVFCCAQCEREYWRKRTKHPTSLTNWHTSEYKSFERRENERDSVKALMKEIDEYEATPDDHYRPEVANKALKGYQNER